MEELREQGNASFKASEFRKARQHYTRAIELAFDSLSLESTDLSTMLADMDEKVLSEKLRANECLQKCFNNRSQCNLKLEKYTEAYEDASKVLLASPDDTKALFRRCQALKQLQRLDEAMRDARRLLTIEPNNKPAVDFIQSLSRYIHDKTNEQNSTRVQVKNMLEMASGESGEKQLTALNNLIVLAREAAGASEIIDAGGINQLLSVLKSAREKAAATDTSNDTKKNADEVKLAITRIFASLSKNSFKRAKIVYNEVQPELIGALISDASEAISTAAALIVQNMIYSLTDLNEKRRLATVNKKPVNESFEFTYEVQQYIDEIFRAIVMLIMEPTCSGFGRDNCIDLCLKFVDRANGCGWTLRYVVFGVPKLLRVAATVPELRTPHQLALTEHTKMHVACCLSAVYDDTYSDSEREKYQEVVDSFVKDLLKRTVDEDKHAKLRAIACVGVLLQGPFDVGMAIIVRNNLLMTMLDLADSDDLVQERVAIEAVVYSASKKDKATGILSEGIDILKKLYQSKNQSIKVRALVGLCKLASCKGSDVSIKLLADGSSLKLERACRKILCTAADYDTKKWACDGLAYLTLDADMKEILAADTNALHIMYELTKREDKHTLYSIATVLSNMCNAQPTKKPTEEMVKLAEYAKHHIPAENAKDGETFYKARRQALIASGVCTALAHMAKHKSDSCRELIASVYLVLCENSENHGTIVAAGGGKALLPLALDGTETGKARATHALAKIAITINPELAFPGQRCMEVVRPLIRLLHPDKTALENYETLMALTNLAGVDEATRKRMLKEEAMSNVEHYMFDEHTELRRAACECMCNMVQDDEVVRMYERTGNDRVKLLVLYCDEELDDMRLNMAASGALAQLTGASTLVCERALQVKSFGAVFKQAACAAHVELQFRIFYVLRNVAASSREACVQLVATEVMEVIVALSRLDVEQGRAKVKQLATEIVKMALEHGLIKPTIAGLADTVEAPDSDDETKIN